MKIFIDTFVFFLISITLPSYTTAKTISDKYRIDWDPGIQSTTRSYNNILNIQDFGAVGDGISDDTNAFLRAIESSLDYTIILIPAGVFLINKSLKLKSKTIVRGAGSNKTFLKFKLKSKVNAIVVANYSNKKYVKVKNKLIKGSFTLELDSYTFFHPGDYIEIRQDNDPNLILSGKKGKTRWGKSSIGQINKVISVNSKKITLKRPLYFTYNPFYTPRVRKLNTITSVGIENLSIERLDKNGKGYNIAFIGAVNSWVKNITSLKTLSAHVLLRSSFSNEVKNNIFDDSFLHGAGGQGYGIKVQNRSTDNLIENNSFNHLRHSMSISLGATGNVFAYNYSVSPYTSQSENWISSDISIHGHYPYMNLFEGNFIQKIEVDNVWGTNGSNTFFRNRVAKPKEKYPALEIASQSKFQNVIGNEFGLLNSKGNPIKISNKVITETLMYCNYNGKRQLLVRDNSFECKKRTLPNSYYLSKKPNFFKNITWPPFGLDVLDYSIKLPAQLKYEKYKKKNY